MSIPQDSEPRVLLITKCFDVGGTEAHVRILANGLSEMGTPVVIATESGRQCDMLNSSIHFVPVKLGVLSLIANLVKIHRLIRLHEINVIHAHSRRGICFSSVASFVFRIPLVVTVHGRVKYDLRSRFARYQASRVILVNRNTQRSIQHYKFLTGKLVTIQNGSSVECLPRLEPENPIAFLYISRIDRKHFGALELLISVFESDEIREKASLHIIGDGEFAANLIDRISDSASKNISYSGYENDPAQFFKKTHVVIGVGRVATDGLCADKAVYTLNGAYRGQLVTKESFDSLLDSNFVNVDTAPPEVVTVAADIQEIIHKAHHGLLPTRSQIGIEKIEALSVNNQFQSTLNVYKQAIEK